MNRFSAQCCGARRPHTSDEAQRDYALQGFGFSASLEVSQKRPAKSRLARGLGALLPQVKDAIQTELSDNPSTRPRRTQRAAMGRGASAVSSSKYSRLEADVAAMQRDSGTYCDDPPDSDAYEAWLKVQPVPLQLVPRTAVRNAGSLQHCSQPEKVVAVFRVNVCVCTHVGPA